MGVFSIRAHVYLEELPKTADGSLKVSHVFPPLTVTILIILHQSLYSIAR